MALFPVYDFSDLSLNYTTVQNTVKSMFSYINEKRYSGLLSISDKAVLTEVDPILIAMRYDSSASGELNNFARWKKDVEYAYKYLYPIAN